MHACIHPYAHANKYIRTNMHVYMTSACVRIILLFLEHIYINTYRHTTYI